jgi:hypothetical protein
VAKDKPGSPSPSDFPVTPPPPPSGDFSYTLEVVMGMQNVLGKLTEAVEGLKAKSQIQTEKTESLGKDVQSLGRDIYAAKVVIGVVGAFVGLVGIFLGIVLKALLDYLLRTQGK